MIDKVLCISADGSVVAPVAQKFAENGCGFVHEADIDRALAMLGDTGIKLVVVGVDETLDLQKQLGLIRRAARRHVYILLLTDDWPVEAALELGANDVLSVQPSVEAVLRALEKVRRIFAMIEDIGDQRIDFPSVGGVIARSAFYQLFLTGLDRAGRYGEKTYLIFIALDNYDELYSIGGDYVADYAAALLSRRLIGMRRQSDILGQIAKNTYALLLQRPTYETEPLEAVQRFVSALSIAHEIAEGTPVPLQVRVSLIDVPCGDLLHESFITLDKV